MGSSEELRLIAAVAGDLPMGVCVATDLGGRIEVEGQPGRGSTFRVLLPAAVTEPPRPEASPVLAPVWRRASVLLVDDEPQIVRVLSLLLGPHRKRG